MRLGWFPIALYVGALAFLVTMTVVDLTIGDRMFSESLDFSVRFQRSTGFEWLAWIMSFPITFGLIGYCALAFFVWKDKVKAANPFLNVFVFLFWSSFLKLIYVDSRPSFESLALKEGGAFCEKDYGKPSGHAYAGAAFTMLAAYDFNTYVWKNDRWNWLSYIAAGVVTTLIIFARLYYGVHSSNQLLLGAAWGLAQFATSCASREVLARFVFTPCLVRKGSRVERRVAFVAMGGLGLAQLALLLGRWAAVWKDESLSAPFFEAIVNCTEVKDNLAQGFATKLAADGLTGLFLPSMFLGCLLGPRPCYRAFSLYPKPKPGLAALRALLLIVFLAPMILAFFPKATEPTGKLLRVALILPFFGFLLGFLYPFVVEKLGLLPDPSGETQELVPPSSPGRQMAAAAGHQSSSTGIQLVSFPGVPHPATPMDSNKPYSPIEEQTSKQSALSFQT